MKLGARQWCRIQEFFANLKCPNCFSAKVDLTEIQEENAECIDCGCKFEFDPDIIINHE